MPVPLIIYSSTDGHTKIICQKIINSLNDKDAATLVSLDEVTKFDLSTFDKIIIGASIRYGKHDKQLYKFINANKNLLNQKYSIFFSVNAVARKQKKNSPETNPYIKKFLKISNWRPKKIGVFAGKVDYPNYNFFDKYIIKFIMFVTGGPTDTSKSYEFTDWSKVDDFAKELNLKL
mgnify:CR=1 FL=1|tara:strand:+ start:439 stop:966 length:528 start_codon:yes stop_codon:yes gene_type:complete